MRVTQLQYKVLVNMGNYENRQVGMSAEPQEGEDPAEAMGTLIDLVHRQAGKPTRAEAAAVALLDQVDELWLRADRLRGNLHRRYTSLSTVRPQIQELAGKVERSEWDMRRLKELRGTLTEMKQELPQILAQEQQTLAQAQEREHTQEVADARQLLGRPRPELRILPEVPQAPEAEQDDIPFEPEERGNAE